VTDYPPDSRYAGAETLTRLLPDGREVAYIRHRWVPSPGPDEAVLHEHVVRPNDRLDTLAAQYYGNSLLWWRIADANGAGNPDDLLVPGRRLRIPAPGGLGGGFPGTLP
jgi:nucleoid-associated protein YgaU